MDRQAYVDAAQRAAGLLAAKYRKDELGVDALWGQFPDDATMATGFMLLAELAVTYASAIAEESPEAILAELSLLAAKGFPEP